MKANTESEKPEIGTVCSVLIENGKGEILVKETPEGLSLLGGFVDWTLGFPECLESLIADEQRIEIKPRLVQRVFQNYTTCGSWITNINVIASCDSSRDKKNSYWVDKHRILEGAYQLRSPDLSWAIGISLQNIQGAGLDFVTVTEKDPQNSRSKSIGMPVTGMVIKNPNTKKFLLMQCGKAERDDYEKWSLLGGTVHFGEGRSTTVVREVQEEGGIIPFEVGLVGVYVNHVRGFGHVANIASAGFQYREQVQASEGFKGEVKEFNWLTLDEINAMEPKTFRTMDTPLAIRHAEWLSDHRGYFDRSLVSHIG